MGKKTKLAYISLFYPEWHTEYDIAQGLIKYAKWDVNIFESRQPHHFINAISSNKYDIVMTSIPAYFNKDFWRRVKRNCELLITWYFDWVFGIKEREERYKAVLPEFDIVFSTDGFSDEHYRQIGVKRIWLPHFANTEIYRPIEKEIETDIVFIGHVYTDRRKRLLDLISRYWEVRIVGGHNECWLTRYSETCNSARLVFGDSYRVDIPGYWSDRLYLTLASGGCLLFPKIEGLERWFEDDRHLVYYSGEDIIDRISHIINNLEKIRYIKAEAVKEIKRAHSLEVRICEMLNHLSKSGLWGIQT